MEVVWGSWWEGCERIILKGGGRDGVKGRGLRGGEMEEQVTLKSFEALFNHIFIKWFPIVLILMTPF